MTSRALVTFLLALSALWIPTDRAEAVEFLFHRDHYTHRECREPVRAVGVYRRGTVGRHYSAIETPAKYRWRTRRVLVHPPYRTENYRGSSHGWRHSRKSRGHLVVRHHPGVYRTIRERVLVRPVKYRAKLHRGQKGWVRDYAIVADNRIWRHRCQ